MCTGDATKGGLICAKYGDVKLQPGEWTLCESDSADGPWKESPIVVPGVVYRDDTLTLFDSAVRFDNVSIVQLGRDWLSGDTNYCKDATIQANCTDNTCHIALNTSDLYQVCSGRTVLDTVNLPKVIITERSATLTSSTNAMRFWGDVERIALFHATHACVEPWVGTWFNLTTRPDVSFAGFPMLEMTLHSPKLHYSSGIFSHGSLNVRVCYCDGIGISP